MDLNISGGTLPFLDDPLRYGNIVFEFCGEGERTYTFRYRMDQYFVTKTKYNTFFLFK